MTKPLEVVRGVVEDGWMVDPEPSPIRHGRRRRPELGAFLKAQRARMHPEDHGIPPGERRRTPGLRREEVAMLAGVGLTWYTWLEQGRPINASYQVLDAVARTLRMDPAERQHLYHLADATPVATTTRAPCVPEAVKVVVDSLDPLPAVLINTRFDGLSANAAFTEVFEAWHGEPCLYRNLVWCNLAEQGGRDRLPDYDEAIPYLVARLRSNYGRHVADAEWNADIERLTDLSPEFARLWARHEVAEPQVRLRRFRHPLGDLAFTMTELDVSAVRDLRIMTYAPADAQTWALIPRIRLDARSRAGVPVG